MAHYNELNANLLRLDTYTVATMPSPTDFAGGLIYVKDGNAGAPALAFAVANKWFRVSIGTEVSTTV